MPMLAMAAIGAMVGAILMSNYRQHGSLIGLILTLASCSAQPEGGTGGACKLSCSGSRIGGAEFKIVALQPALTLACVGDFSAKSEVALGSPITVRYKIYQDVVTTFPSPAANGGGNAGGGAASTDPGNTNPLTLPAASIGFEPVVYGSMALDKTVADFRGSDGNVNPAKYGGIVTPPSEWCSDSCGVMTFEVWPNCVKGGQQVTAGVLSGAVSKDVPKTIVNLSNSQ